MNPTPKKPKRAGRVMWRKLTVGDVRPKGYQWRFKHHPRAWQPGCCYGARITIGDVMEHDFRAPARATLLADGVPAKLLKK